MKKQVRLVLSAVLALSLVGAFAMFGCSSNNTTTEKKDDAAKTEQAEPVELQVFAANSLSKAMEDIQKAYIEDGHDNVTFKDTQYKSSGELNEMLGAGSYADLLISASEGSMDTAVSKGYVDGSTRVDMFKNDLVMVSKEGADIKDVTLDDIAAGKYTLAVGDENVPAGNYACQSLTTVGSYIEPDGATGADATGKGGEFSATLQPKVTLGGKVGDVCKYAESGEVDIAMVYTSDVYRMGGVAICSVVPNDTHKAITYPGAVCTDSKSAETAQAFLEWCMTDEDANQIWEKWGFELAQN